jgi:hypothetical protein
MLQAESVRLHKVRNQNLFILQSCSVYLLSQAQREGVTNCLEEVGVLHGSSNILSCILKAVMVNLWERGQIGSVSIRSKVFKEYGIAPPCCD